MTKLREIKKLLKKNHQWKQYTRKYDHFQMRLVLSKVALIWNPQADVETLYQKEVEILNAKKEDQEEMFVKAFEGFGKIVNTQKANWKEFAHYLWFVYQTSTYWYDIKVDVKNVYNKNNYIKINHIKRKYYNQWIESIDLRNDGVNDKVIKIQKEIF